MRARSGAGARDATKTREEELFVGYLHCRKHFSDKPAKYPGSAYVLLHTLSHASMAEIALDRGYPPSSLKERVYALPGPDARWLRGSLRHPALHGDCSCPGHAEPPRFARVLQGAVDRSAIWFQRSGVRRPRARRAQWRGAQNPGGSIDRFALISEAKS